MKFLLHTNSSGGHWKKVAVLLSWDFYWLSLVLCRTTHIDTFFLAHIPSHHVAKSQDGTVLSLRALYLVNISSFKVKNIQK